MVIETHVLPSSSSPPQQQQDLDFSWFTEKVNQEFLALVYEAIISFGSERENQPNTGNVRPSKSSQKYQFKYSRNLRILYTFKPNECRQHLVIPEHTSVFSGLIPRAVLISEQGRKVLPFLNQRTTGGSGYKALHILGNCMEAYVDSYPRTDPKGVMKVLSQLSPGSSINPSIESYFQPPSSSSSSSTSLGLAVDGVCSLSEIPVTTALRVRQGGALRPTRQRRQTKRKLPGDQSNKQPLSAKRGKIDSSSSPLGDAAGNSSKQLSVTDFLERKRPDSAATNSDICVDLTEEAVNDFCDFDSEAEGTTKPDLSDDLLLTPRLRQKHSSQLVHTPPMRALKTIDLPDTKEPAGDTTDAGDTADTRDTVDARDTADAVDTIDLDETPPLSPNPSHSLHRSSSARPTHEEQISVYYTSDIVMEDYDYLTPEVSLLPSPDMCPPQTSLPSHDTSPQVSILSHDTSPQVSIPSPDTSPQVSIPSHDTSPQASMPSPEIDPGSPSSLNCCVIKDSCESVLRHNDHHLPMPSLDDEEEEEREEWEKEEEEEGEGEKESEEEEGEGEKEREEEEEEGVEDKEREEGDNLGDASKEQSSQIASADETGVEVVDLTTAAESSVLLIESSDSSSEGSGRHPSHSGLSSAERRQRMKQSPREVVCGAESVSSLTSRQLKRWMFLSKPLMIDIFKRQVYSLRHEEFVTGSCRKREALKYRVDTRMFASEQVELITHFLLRIFCGRHMKFFSYVMSVLLPECLIRVIADVFEVSFDEAEKKMLNYREPCLHESDSDSD